MRKKCKAKSCESKHHAKGMCKKHYNYLWNKEKHKANPSLQVYWDMKQRCYNKKSRSYKYYGARGIYVCSRWLGKDGYKNFLADMGERPKDLTLDRIDNNLGYSPDNCKWSTAVEQSSNKRRPLSRSGERYISWNEFGSRWLIRIVRNNKMILCETTRDLNLAIEIRNNKLKEINDKAIY